MPGQPMGRGKGIHHLVFLMGIGISRAASLLPKARERWCWSTQWAMAKAGRVACEQFMDRVSTQGIFITRWLLALVEAKD